MRLTPIAVHLSGILKPEDKYIPLYPQDNAKLLADIPEGEEMIMTIKDNLNYEWVKVTNQYGTLLLERGLDDSTPLKFPRGACLFFEASLPVIKWLICNFECCGSKYEKV